MAIEVRPGAELAMIVRTGILPRFSITFPPSEFGVWDGMAYTLEQLAKDLRAELSKSSAENCSEALCRIVKRALMDDDFVATLDGLAEKHAEAVYTYSFATLAFLRAHSSEWSSLAELPQAEALVKRYLEISGDSAKAGAHRRTRAAINK